MLRGKLKGAQATHPLQTVQTQQIHYVPRCSCNITFSVIFKHKDNPKPHQRFTRAMLMTNGLVNRGNVYAVSQSNNV